MTAKAFTNFLPPSVRITTSVNCHGLTPGPPRRPRVEPTAPYFPATRRVRSVVAGLGKGLSGRSFNDCTPS